MPFPCFDRSRLILKPLEQRVHDIDRSMMIYPDSPREPFEHKALPILAERIVEGRKKDAAVMFCYGAHVLRKGNGPLTIDLMKRGLVTHLALNGAGAIHDFELAMIGETCESVARYVRTGEFGLWNETGLYNEAANNAAKEGIGLGEALGNMILERDFPYAETSVLAAGAKYGVPVTVHVAFGQDIVHEHPNFDPATMGQATYTDFLVYTQSIMNLEGGVFLNAGSAVMGPEVYLKALTMARNVAHQEGKNIGKFTTGLFDMIQLGEDEDLKATVDKSDPRYYFRPYKTILVRTCADGGESFYVRGDHRQTVPHLYDEVIKRV